MYPEFRFRRPPPSYNVSMQEYQQQLMLAQLQANNEEDNHDNYSLPSSPPPTYRSQASTVRPGLHITFPPGSEGHYSHPPTYRSAGGESHRRPSLELQDINLHDLGDHDSMCPHSFHMVVEHVEGAGAGENSARPQVFLPSSYFTAQNIDNNSRRSSSAQSSTYGTASGPTISIRNRVSNMVEFLQGRIDEYTVGDNRGAAGSSSTEARSGGASGSTNNAKRTWQNRGNEPNTESVEGTDGTVNTQF